MASRTLIHSLRARIELPQSARTCSRAGRRRARLHRPQWDLFEDRTLLSTFLVTTAADNGDDTNPVPGSLRQAIIDVNNDTSNTAADTIDFAIPGAGVQDIQPLTNLPMITHPVLVDGYSQPCSRPNTLADGDNAVPLIELDGSLDVSGYVNGVTNRQVTNGISTSAADSIVRGMIVNNFFTGIYSFGVVEGDFIGTDPSGTQAQGNVVGVYNATLVGTNGDGVDDFAERNLISGNWNYGVEMFAPQGLVAGNFIGTDVTGTQPLGNCWGVRLVAGRVGADGRDADPVAERNIISGNMDLGILVSSNCVVAGNYIGTDVTGELGMGNDGGTPYYRAQGVYLGGIDVVVGGGSDNNIIGTNDDGIGDDYERNIISGGNASGNADGIELAYASGNIIAGNYIGTDKTGTVALGNRQGVVILGTSHDNRIGADGRDPYPDHERNIILGNGQGVNIGQGYDNVIAGNYIGTDVTGSTSVGADGKSIGNLNGIFAQYYDQNDLIGTNSDGVGDQYERNIISGNRSDGIYEPGSSLMTNDVVAGNYIGTDVTGTQPLENGGFGIDFRGGGTGILIGVNSHAVNPSAGRNVISNNGGGILLDARDPDTLPITQTVIAGNYVGTDFTGETALGNGEGILVANAVSTRIGTDGDGLADAIERNVISSNDSYGVGIFPGAIGTVVAGNFIGTDDAGTAPLGNTGPGVLIWQASGTEVGGAGDMGNTIAYSRANGIASGVLVVNSVGDSILGNSIFGNARLGIDYGFWNPGFYDYGVVPNNTFAGQPGPNDFQNFPVLTAAYAGGYSAIVGTFNSTPNASFRIEFFSNPAQDPSGYGQGKTYLGFVNVTTDASGNATINASGLAATIPGQWVSATATAPDGSTSEFSLDVKALYFDTTTLASSANPSVYGQAVTFTATVAAASPDEGTPTGSVQFVVDGTNFGTPIDLVDGSATSSAIDSLGAGSHTVTAVYSGDPDFTASTAATLSQVVDPAPLTVTASDATKVYGASLPGFSASESGFVLGQDAGVLSGTLDFSTPATTGSHVQAGGYPIAPGGLAAANYAITFVSGTLAITPVPLTISADDQAMVYGGTQPALTASDSGLVNGDTPTSLITPPTLSTVSPHSHVGSYAITAAGAFDPDYTISYAGGTLTISPAPLTIAANSASMVYGAPLPALTASYTGLVNGDTSSSLPTPPALSTTATTSSPVGGYMITVGGAVDHDYTIRYSGGTLTINLDPTTTVVAASANPSFFGQALTFSATVTANSPGSGTPTGAVDFFDTTTGTDLGSVSTTNGTAAATVSSLPLGPQAITVTYGGNGNLLASHATITVSVVPSIFVLDPSAAGALTLSGNASITIPGLVVVDSSSKSAFSAAGNAQVTASAIDVVGGVQKSGNAAFHPAPTTGIATVADPLAALPSPATTGMSNYGSLSLSGNSSRTIPAGIYSQISVAGNASLTMSGGIYIIEGGGFTVTGNASVAGSGVMIYNAGTNYPSSGGTFGGITLSGNGAFNLTAPTAGTYANILIFQSRQNTRALSFSGNAMAGMSGTIYAASALLSMSGNSQLQNPLDVGMLNLSGNVSLTQTAEGSDGSSGDASGIANTLLAGNLSAYINDPGGLFTADELTRIQDAINVWDAILVPYNVAITEVSDPSLANLVIDTGTTSASGGAADGVLGCFDASADEVTILRGWNWYAGADPSQIGADQYDFQTTVTHELGHALGLGHSTDPASPMFATLATGVADRTVSTQDLNIPDPPDGADPQTAAGFRPVIPSVIIAVAPDAETVTADGVGVMPLDGSITAQGAVPPRGSRSGSSASRRVTVPRPGHGQSFAVSGGRRISFLNARLVDSVLGEIGTKRSLLRRS